MDFFERLKWRCIWSWHGLRNTWATERSFRQWVWVNLASGALAVVLLDGGELALILSLGVLVLASELKNTAIERTVDLVSLEKSELAKQAKDAGSAGVAVTAVAVGVAWIVVLVT